jgi:hypothetical protein
VGRFNRLAGPFFRLPARIHQCLGYQNQKSRKDHFLTSSSNQSPGKLWIKPFDPQSPFDQNDVHHRHHHIVWRISKSLSNAESPFAITFSTR